MEIRGMPQFQFHLTNGKSVRRDAIGLDLCDLPAARLAAREALVQYLLDQTRDGQPFPDHTTIEICDENGRVLDLALSWCLLRDPTPLEVDTTSCRSGCPPAFGITSRGTRRRVR